jgi:Fe2+ or Zn2+ uptake regulation protein
MITCTKCGKEDEVTLDDAHDACDAFSEDGWRMTNDKVYCKTCFKKKTKKK